MRKCALCVAIALFPFFASAHEVYVLSPRVIDAALAAPAFSEWDVFLQNVGLFSFWALIGIIVVTVVFAASISRKLEDMLDPMLAKLPRYAPLVGRVTIGLSFLAAAYYGAIFGPELPLQVSFGAAEGFIRLLLVAIGMMLVVGFYPRVAVVAALSLYCVEAYDQGLYILTYTNYFGEMLVIAILGAHAFALENEEVRTPVSPRIRRLKKRFTPYAFPLLRVAFGISLIYASLYAKVIHNQLALAVAAQYPDIVSFFGFEPHFLVLGAAIIEIALGFFFIFGIEIRFASLFLLFWLSLSLWYFAEAVWPHVILIGIPVAFIMYGYDKYSLEGRFFKTDTREPVL